MYKSSPKNTTLDFGAVHKGSTLVKVLTGVFAESGFGPPNPPSGSFTIWLFVSSTANRHHNLD